MATGTTATSCSSRPSASTSDPDFELRSILDPANASSVAQRLGAGIRDSDAIVIGGGDIVIPWTSSSRYWETAYLRRPVFVAGVGVPTFRASVPAAVDRLRSFFSDPAVRFIGTRDQESGAWIEANLHPTAPVRIAPDLICGLTLPPVAAPGRPADLRRRRPQPKPAGRPDPGPPALRAGGRARLPRPADRPGDRPRPRPSTMRRPRASGCPTRSSVSSDDLDAISRAIGECTALASMKFHGVVVATMYGVPAIATMPTAKTRNFMRGIGRPDLLSAYNNPALPAVLTPDLAPIANETRAALRAGAVAHLEELREAIRATVTGATD